MSEEMQTRLFKPFEQESAETALKHGGSGLGLSIVKSLVHMMDGAIRVESQQGVGTTFIVDIPFAQYEVQNDVSEEEKPVKNTPVFAGKRVMLAEDNELNRIVAKGLINRMGIECDFAEDGQIAVKKFLASKEGYYNAILMDIQMPNMDGYEATRAIRGSSHPDAKKIQIIALTANVFTEDIAKALSVGMNAHAAKPIESEVLADTLRKAFAE